MELAGLSLGFFVVSTLLTVISLLVAAWIFSLVFRVNKTIELQKIQIKMLYKMAEQSGIDKAELNNIVKNDGDLIAFPVK